MAGSAANRDFDRVYRAVRVLTGPLTRFEASPVPDSALAAMDGPSIIVSNHRSIFDAVAAVRVLGGMGLPARPLSAAWLWEVVGLGAVLDHLHAIPLGPGRAALAAIDTAVSHLEAGGRLLVTPEGRVVAPEDRVAGVGDGHKIVSRIACAAGVAVVPSALIGTDELWPLGRRTPVVRPWHRPVVRFAFGSPRTYPSADHRSNVEATMADIAELVAGAVGYRMPRMTGSEPLNELDVALLGLQRERRPWSVHFEVELGDALSSAAIEAGVEHALARHPRAGAALEQPEEGPRWVLGRFGAGDLLTEASRAELLDREFSLPTEPPVRIARLDDGQRLLVAVNHAVADGLGGAALVHDLLDGAAGSHDRSPRQPVPAGLATRLAPRYRLAALRSMLSTARYVLGGGGSTSADLGAPTTVATVTLDPDLRRRLIAGHAGLGLNDLFLAATHTALRDLLDAPRAGRVAVSVPVDLRRHIGHPRGLGNAIVSALTSSRRRGGRPTVADDLALAARLGSAVRRQAEPPWLAGATAMFVAAAARGRRHPPRDRTGRLRWPDTAVCSNLGDLDSFGPAWSAVRSLTFTPPAHDLMSIGVASAGGSTTIAARQRGGGGEPRAMVDGIVSRLDAMLS